MVGITAISIPGSDGILFAYSGITLVSVVVDTASPPAADLLIYDNATTGSGNLVAVVSASAANGTFPVGNQCSKGMYIKNVTGWTGTLWFSGSAI